MHYEEDSPKMFSRGKPEFDGEHGNRTMRERKFDSSAGDNTDNNRVQYRSTKSIGFDNKLSTLIRALAVETKNENTIQLCSLIKQAIEDDSNVLYIKRNFRTIVSAIIEAIPKSSPECHGPLEMVLGTLGSVCYDEFQLYFAYIVKEYTKRKSYRTTLMNALMITIERDCRTIYLGHAADKIMDQLKKFLETTDIAQDFLAIIRVVVQISKNYRAEFARHFTDFVDIIIGWHLAIEQPSLVKLSCSNILQEFEPFWKRDFAQSLLEQFLEDIYLCGEELLTFISTSSCQLHPTNENLPSAGTRFGSLLGAFNTVLKCLMIASESPALSENFIQDSVFKVLEIETLLHEYFPRASRAEIVSQNEFIVLMFSLSESKLDHSDEKIFDFIYYQIGVFEHYHSDDQLLSALFLILTYIKAKGNSLSLEFVNSMGNFRSNFWAKRFSRNSSIRRSLLLIYKTMLGIKNVSILQEMYKFMLDDIEEAFTLLRTFSCTDTKMSETELSLSTQTDSDCRSEAECIIGFNITALSTLANTSYSIIAMWALNPSIIQLFIHKMCLLDDSLWRHHYSLRFTILKLLIAHCCKNKNFINSSSMLSTAGNPEKVERFQSDSLSPTSEHFSLVIDFVQSFLQMKNLNSELLSPILEWSTQIFTEIIPFTHLLAENKHLIAIVTSICDLSNHSDNAIVLKCGESLKQYLNLKHSNATVLASISKVACLKMFATNSDVRKIFATIFSHLPLAVALPAITQFTTVLHQKTDSEHNQKPWQFSMNTNVNVRLPFMKDFFKKTSLAADNQSGTDKWLFEVFKNCWHNDTTARREFSRQAMYDLRFLTSWIQWEIAQYWVKNKLRISVGKPIDTLRKIEDLITMNTQLLEISSGLDLKCWEDLIAKQKLVHILIGFLESLEKAIYNASQGTAFAIPAPEKSARSFFHLNHAICKEWFLRIHMIVNEVALHCMEPEMVIRYSEKIITHLVTKNKTNDPIFEHILVSLVWALLRNGESDTLLGLCVWLQREASQDVSWIKMAAEQAAGRSEVAEAGYAELLASPELIGKLHYVHDFVADQYVLCLIAIGNWKQVHQFQLTEQNRKRTSPSTVLMNADYINFMLNLENYSSDEAISQLANWDTIFEADKTNKEVRFAKLVPFLESTIASQILKSVNTEVVTNSTKYNLTIDIVRDCLQECIRKQSIEHLHHLVILNHIAHKTERQSDPVDTSSWFIPKQYGSSSLIRVLNWHDALAHNSRLELNENVDLRLNVIRRARKEKNFKFAEHQLRKYFVAIKFTEEPLDKQHDTLAIITNLFSKQFAENWNVDILHGAYETCKMLFCHGDKKQKAVELAAFVCLGTISQSTSNSAPLLRKSVAKILLTLAEWIQSEPTMMRTMGDTSSIAILLNRLPPAAAQSPFDLIESPVDIGVGKLIKTSIGQCPELAKAWATLGSWSYKWGRKTIEHYAETKSDKNVQARNASEIIHLIPNASLETIQPILAKLSHHLPAERCATRIESFELIESELRTTALLANSSSEHIRLVAEAWQKSNQKLYSYYKISANAYFKFLRIAASTTSTNKINCVMVTATLRILRLIVKHALGLQDVLDEEFLTTPTGPWKLIIPQLFARLDHNEPYVRRKVSDLICQIASDAPHLIIFPAVVGASQKHNNLLTFDPTDQLTKKTTASKSDDRTRSAMFASMNSLLEILSQNAKETVDQIQVLVHELKRITTLWDELWLTYLVKIYPDCMKGCVSITMELKKENSSCEKSTLATKHRTLIEPIILIMENLLDIISRTPETNNERIFKERYYASIVNTIGQLKTTIVDFKPYDSWQSLKQLIVLIQQGSPKGFGSLKMCDISPVLVKMRDTAISMPGIRKEKNLTSIKFIDNIVNVLPTKTKPKKINFHGFDGRLYTYLFKGMEDLHLDERIMQFLSISNLMLTKSVDCNGSESFYRAGHYSVIPLGPRSGLISWIDDVSPIYSVYKKWQQRDAHLAGNEKNSVLRPAEMFYRKLAPLQNEYSFKMSDNRKEWPIGALKRVLADLSASTPKDLLAKEFWCHCATTVAWRKVILNYSNSIAVMSVIGYIIGLGDRHLDNILVDFLTGDILHIDYNVCFEKGRTLRVPENVPFRMTQNLEDALGFTGVEGPFRLTCEQVLSALKKGRETLLTLLEAFVYDPLVDWAIGEVESDTNCSLTTDTDVFGAAISYFQKQVECEILQDTKQYKFAALKSEWRQIRKDRSAQMIDLKKTLRKTEKKLLEIKTVQNNLALLSLERAFLKEFNVPPGYSESDAVSSLSKRLIAHQQTIAELKKVRERIADEYDYSVTITVKHKLLEKHGIADFDAKFTEIFKKSSSCNMLADLTVENSNSMTKDLNYRYEKFNKNMFQALLPLRNTLQLIERYTYMFGMINRNIIAKDQYCEWWSEKLLKQNESPAENDESVHRLNEIIEFIQSDAYCANLQIIANTLENNFTIANTKRNSISLALSNHFPSKDLPEVAAVQELKSQLVAHYTDRNSSSLKVIENCIAQFLLNFKQECIVKASAIQSGSTSDGIQMLRQAMAVITEMLRVFVKSPSDNQKFDNLLKCCESVETMLQKLEDFLAVYGARVMPFMLYGKMSEHIVPCVCEQMNTFDLIDEVLCELEMHKNDKNCAQIDKNSVEKISVIQRSLSELFASYQNCTYGNGEDIMGGFLVIFQRLNEQNVTLWEELKTLHDLMGSLECANEIEVLLTSTECVDAMFEMKFWRAIKANKLFNSNLIEVSECEAALNLLANCLDDNCMEQFVTEYLTNSLAGVVPYLLTTFVALITQPSEIVSPTEISANADLEISTDEDNCAELCEKFNSILTEFQTSIADIELAKHFHRSLDYYEKLSRNYQTIYTAHFWLYETHLDELPQPCIRTLTRKSFYSQLNRHLKMIGQQHSSQNQMEKIRNYLNLMKSHYAHKPDGQIQLEKIKIIEDNMDDQKRILLVTLKTGQKISDIELDRQKNSETQVKRLQLMLELTEQLENCTKQLEVTSNSVSPTGLSIFERYPPQFPLDKHWIEMVCTVVRTKFLWADRNANRVDQSSLKQNLLSLLDRLRDNFHQQRLVITKMHDLLELSAEDVPQSISEDRIVKYIRKAKHEHLNEMVSNDLFGQLKSICDEIESDELRTFENLENDFVRKSSLNRYPTEQVFPSAKESDETNLEQPEEPRSSTSLKKKNGYAISVWRRIRIKLEGRDPDSNSRSTIPKQVDWLLREATSPDNLARLYEGWTPWV